MERDQQWRAASAEQSCAKSTDTGSTTAEKTGKDSSDLGKKIHKKEEGRSKENKRRGSSRVWRR